MAGKSKLVLLGVFLFPILGACHEQSTGLAGGSSPEQDQLMRRQLPLTHEPKEFNFGDGRTGTKSNDDDHSGGGAPLVLPSRPLKRKGGRRRKAEKADNDRKLDEEKASRGPTPDSKETLRARKKKIPKDHISSDQFASPEQPKLMRRMYLAMSMAANQRRRENEWKEKEKKDKEDADAGFKPKPTLPNNAADWKKRGEAYLRHEQAAMYRPELRQWPEVSEAHHRHQKQKESDSKLQTKQGESDSKHPAKQEEGDPKPEARKENEALSAPIKKISKDHISSDQATTQEQPKLIRRMFLAMEMGESQRRRENEYNANHNNDDLGFRPAPASWYNQEANARRERAVRQHENGFTKPPDVLKWQQAEGESKREEKHKETDSKPRAKQEESERKPKPEATGANPSSDCKSGSGKTCAQKGQKRRHKTCLTCLHPKADM